MPQKPNQTTENQNSVFEFLDKIEEEGKRKDAYAFLEVFTKSSGIQPKMWGPAIIGFGSYHYVYASGREGDAPLAAFSPRKNGFSLYLSTQFKERAALLEKFGKYTTPKACIYVKHFSAINQEVLSELVQCSVTHMKSIYPKS